MRERQGTGEGSPDLFDHGPREPMEQVELADGPLGGRRVWVEGGVHWLTFVGAPGAGLATYTPSRERTDDGLRIYRWLNARLDIEW